MRNFDCKQCKVSAERSIFLTKLFKKLSRSGEAHTEAGVVLSKKLTSARFPTPGSTWDHLVTFQLQNGNHQELIVPEELFSQLTPGKTGTITWEGENLLSFDERE